MNHRPEKKHQVTAFVIFLVGLYFCFGKYGKIRLGDCKPEYSNFSYFAMMLLASLASAALYWSFVEWAFYFESPGLGMEVLSQEALEMSLSYQFFHWGMVNQAMYTIMGVAIAYGVYIRKLPSFQTSAVCCAMLGEKVKPQQKTVIGKIIDFLVFFGILGALSSSLGLAVPLATGGLKTLFNIEATPAVKLGVVGFIAIVYTITSFLGPRKGMQAISNAASAVCVFFLLFVLVTGPTSFILKNIVNSVGQMLQYLPQMALFTDPHYDRRRHRHLRHQRQFFHLGPDHRQGGRAGSGEQRRWRLCCVQHYGSPASGQNAAAVPDPGADRGLRGSLYGLRLSGSG